MLILELAGSFEVWIIGLGADFLRLPVEFVKHPWGGG
jgi:hypothetical protein